MTRPAHKTYDLLQLQTLLGISERDLLKCGHEEILQFTVNWDVRRKECLNEKCIQKSSTLPVKITIQKREYIPVSPCLECEELKNPVTCKTNWERVISEYPIEETSWPNRTDFHVTVKKEDLCITHEEYERFALSLTAKPSFKESTTLYILGAVLSIHYQDDKFKKGKGNVNVSAISDDIIARLSKEFDVEEPAKQDTTFRKVISNALKEFSKKIPS